MPHLTPAAKILAVFSFFAISLQTSAQSPDLVSELREDVAFLSDSLSAGREFGSKEALGTAFYVNKVFREAGLWTRFQIFRKEGVNGRNVIGFTPGFYDDYIVVGAHFDGLGAGEDGYYPGADSNASGTAALLALARSMKHAGSRTGVIFVAFDAHGRDMEGSRAFLEEIGGLHNIKMMVNLDILGSTSAPLREDRPDYLIALGASQYRYALERLNRATRLHLGYDYYGSSRFTDLFYKNISDQKWFVQKRIPSVMFTSGITMDTNRQSDTADKLDYSVMARRVLLIENWLRSLL